MNEHEERRVDWGAIKPVLESFDTEILQLFCERIMGEASPRSGDERTILAWLHNINFSDPLLDKLIQFIQKSKYQCMFDGYDPMNECCQKCGMSYPCESEALIARWRKRTPVQRVESGRIQSSSPNIQNIPRETAKVVAFENNYSVSCEKLKQMEEESGLRVLGINHDQIELIAVQAESGFNTAAEELECFRRRLLEGMQVDPELLLPLKVDPKLLEQRWGSSEITERQFHKMWEKYSKNVTKPLTKEQIENIVDDTKALSKKMDDAVREYRSDRMLCNNELVDGPVEEPEEPEGQQLVIDWSNGKKYWCLECDGPVRAVWNREVNTYLCPKLAKHCMWDCDCGLDDCDEDESHELLTMDELLEYRREKEIKRKKMKVAIAANLKYSKAKRRFDKETTSDTLNKDYLNTRTIGEEIERLEKRVATLKSIENPPQRAISPGDLRDWLSSPIGSLQGVPKKFKTTL